MEADWLPWALKIGWRYRGFDWSSPVWLCILGASMTLITSNFLLGCLSRSQSLNGKHLERETHGLLSLNETHGPWISMLPQTSLYTLTSTRSWCLIDNKYDTQQETLKEQKTLARIPSHRLYIPFLFLLYPLQPTDAVMES